MTKYTEDEKDFILDNWQNVTAKQLAVMCTNLFGRPISEGAIHQFLNRKGLKKDPYTYASDYTEEMCRWIKNNYNKFPNVEAVTNKFNEVFDVHVSKSALWHKAYRLLGCSQVRKTKEKVIQNKWSDEMVQWLTENIDNYSYPDLAKQLNLLFGSNLSSGGVEHKANRLGLKKTVVITKYNGRKTWFSNDHPSWNKKPIGYERVDKQSGIVWVKVAQPMLFVQKHRLIYEMAYGEIPEGINIVFKNGNHFDFRLENLIPMTNSELQLFNRTGIKPEGNDEIANIKLDVMKINQIIKEKRNNER